MLGRTRIAYISILNLRSRFMSILKNYSSRLLLACMEEVMPRSMYNKPGLRLMKSTELRSLFGHSGMEIFCDIQATKHHPKGTI